MNWLFLLVAWDGSVDSYSDNSQDGFSDFSDNSFNNNDDGSKSNSSQEYITANIAYRIMKRPDNRNSALNTISPLFSILLTQFYALKWKIVYIFGR